FPYTTLFRSGPRARRGAAELVRPAGRLSALGLARLAEARRSHPAAAAAPARPRGRDRSDRRDHAAAPGPPAVQGHHDRAAGPAGAHSGAQVDRVAPVAPRPAEAV